VLEAVAAARGEAPGEVEWFRVHPGGPARVVAAGELETMLAGDGS
jgi:hypothetical protein